MALKPLYDRVVVKRTELSNKTAGGLIIPSSVVKEKPQEGEVVAIGDGLLLTDGTLRPLTVQVGDKVLFGKWGSVAEVPSKTEDLLVMKEEDIIAIIA
jgi:chaperonin GroES